MAADPHADFWTVAVPFGSAVGGALLATWTTQSVSRSSRAHALYNAYLERCFANPDLANFSAFQKVHGKGRSFTFNPDVFEGESVEKYHWFIGLMLAAMEEILGIKWYDRGWSHVVRSQVSYHEGYFHGAWRKMRDSYSPALQKIVDELVAGRAY